MAVNEQPGGSFLDSNGFISICVDYAQKAIVSQLNCALNSTVSTRTDAGMKRKRQVNDASNRDDESSEEMIKRWRDKNTKKN